MLKHPVRKFIGLTVLYVVLIVGIFVIQFKSESIISKTIGTMKVSMAQTEDEYSNLILKNQFHVTYKGLIFSGDDETPVKTISSTNYKVTNLKLAAYSEPDENSIQFHFTDGTMLKFTAPEEDSSKLTISAELPEGKESLTIYYTTDKSINISNLSSTKVLAETHAGEFVLVASEATLTNITLTSMDNTATYDLYDPARRFTFDQIADHPLTDQSLYDANVKQIRQQLISAVNQTISSGNGDSLSEAEIVAYIAEMAHKGRWNEALTNIPNSFKRGTKRTYISTPYFGNMSTNYRSLMVDTDRYDSMAKSAMETTNLDIYKVDNIADYLLREKWSNTVLQILTFPKEMLEADFFLPTVEQATGIISTYCKLYKSDRNMAKLLEKPVFYCVTLLEDQCTLEDENFTFGTQQDEYTLEQFVKIANALMEIGDKEKREDYSKAGRLIFNQAYENAGTLDLFTLADIYPFVAKDNTYFPHTVILGYYGTSPVWVWTCAQDVTYTKDSNGTANIRITFPMEQSHYLLFTGVPTFHSQIEIQKVMFRTDPRYETYNSSGYSYDADQSALFIKSRHRSETELIRLFCDPSNNFVTTDIPISY